MREWLRQRPLIYASLGALIVALDGLWLFGDVRPAAIGGVVTFAVGYFAWRPGGFGPKIEAHDQRWRKEHGDGIRLRWLLKGAAIVIGLVLSLGLLIGGVAQLV